MILEWDTSQCHRLSREGNIVSVELSLFLFEVTLSAEKNWFVEDKGSRRGDLHE